MKSNLFRCGLAFAGMLCAQGSAFAELAWEKTALTLEVEPGQEKVAVIFRFTNRGAVPVRILDVHTNCGCTAAKPAKAVYAPGESGELPASMTLNDSSRSVSIQVKTDESSKSDYALSLSVSLLEPALMTPRLLFWKVGEAPTAKRVTLKLRPNVSIVDAAIQGGAFTATLERIETDQVVVWVTPKTTSEKSQATLLLSGRKADRPVELKGFLRVL